MGEKEIIHETVLKTVVTIAKKQATNRVYPHDVLGWIPFDCSIWTVRRYMREMAEQGMLIRNSRNGGYRPAA